MPASALATSAEWQSAVAHHPVGMHRDRSPPAISSGLRARLTLLSVFFSTLLLLAHSSPTHSPTATHNQQYVVCKNLDTQACVTWLLEMQDDRELSNELTPRPSEVCGISDLKPIPPHRKFIAVKLFNEDAKVVFCKNVKVVTEDAFHLADVAGPFTILYRKRRQTGYNLRGRYRGQTQSQYLAIDGGNGKDEGKAEAHSAADSSRASVSGNSGMGQAQSQTIYDPSCDECIGGRNGMEVSNLRRPEQDNYGYGPRTQGQGGVGGNGVPSPGIQSHGVAGGPAMQGHGGMGGQGVPSQGGMGGQGVPSQGGMGGPGMQGHGGMGGQGIPSQGGMTPGMQGQGGMGGQQGPSQGGMGGPRGPIQGGMGGQIIPSQGGMGGPGMQGQGGMGGNGVPSQGGMGGPGMQGQGGIGGNGVTNQGGMNGQRGPSQGGVGGQGIPSQGGMGGSRIPSQGGMGGQGVPSQGGMGGPGIQGQGGRGQGIPSQGGMGGQVIPSQGGMGGPGMQGQGGMGGPGMQGQGGMNGNGVPSQGGMGGPGMQGQGGIGGPGMQGQGGMTPGMQAQGGMGGPGMQGQGGMTPGMQGQGGMGGPGMQAQGGMTPGMQGQGGGMGVQRIPSQGGMGRPGMQGQGGTGGQGIPSQSGMVGPGVQGQRGIGGQGIPSQGGIGGPGVQGQGGIGGQGIPSQGGMGGPGVQGQGGIGGQGIPSQGGMGGPGVQGQGGMGGQGIPSQGGMGAPGMHVEGGMAPGMQGQGGMGVQEIPNQGGMGIPGMQGQGGTGGPGMQGQGGVGGNGISSPGGITPGMQGQGYLPYDTSIVPTGSPGRFNWPLASGTVRGADGLIYYCCVVNPNQGYYPSQGPGSNTGVQGAPPGTYIQTGIGPQSLGGVGQQAPYDQVGKDHGTSYGQGTGPQGTYGNEQPTLPHGTGGVGQPDRNGPYGSTGGTQISTGDGQRNSHGNGGNGQAEHPYIHGQTGPGDGSQQANTYEQGGNGARGPNYSQMNPDGTYVQRGNGQQGPNYNYGSEIPYGSGGNNQQGPDYTYNPSGVIQQGTGDRYGQSGNRPQTSYDTGGNVQPAPAYNYGGIGQPNLGGTNVQTGGIPQGFGSSNYPTGSGGQPSSHTVYQQGPQSTGGSGGLQGGNGQNSPGYSYNTGGGSQPSPTGPYGKVTGGAQTPYDYGGNGQQGPGSTYGQPERPQLPNSVQNSYQNGGNGQQGQDYNQKNGGLGPQSGLGQSQGPGIRTDQNGVPQNVMDPNSIMGENDDSQALASVYQGKNGTTAAASSQGGNEKGHAQTSVQGTYTDSGSFSAQASISDENKGAESQVSGSKKGATSNAEGRGRKNKSQAAVKLGSETGSIQTESQSGGNMHSSNTQVQGSVKGGVADAQARGPGSTSSQAQIGFTPYKEGDKAHESLNTPFEGGGTASAQSSGRMGTSQSQLRGTFKYGITYNGASQAGASLDKDAVFPNFTPFEKIDVFDQNNTNIDINPESTEKPHSVNLPPDTPKIDENTIQDTNVNYVGHSHFDHHKTNEEINTTSILPLPSNRRAFSPSYNSNNNNNGGDYEYNVDDTPTDDYDVEEVPEGVAEDNIPNEYTGYDNYGRDTENTHQSQRQLSSSRKGLEVKQTTGGNTQHILIGSLKNQDAKITQIKSERPDESKIYQPGERVPGMGGYTIPVGFTGSVKSVSSKEKTFVVGSRHSPSQAQTVTLTPGTGKVSYVHPERYGRNNINPKDLKSLYNPRADDNRYVSVSKSVTRDLDSENNIRKQYSHTYYTKSSSCGYFTFTCTMVSSAEGKKKVCRPKIPTNPDGTPMRC